MTSTFARYVFAYKNKITNKLFGVAHVSAVGPAKGTVLLSFLTGPFIQAPGEYFTDPHPNYWTCEEIARLLSIRGYDVDIVEWDNTTFIPKKKYVACIDLHHNLERFSPHLPDTCVKAMFIVSSYPPFQNNAEETRLRNLEKRKGVALSFKRKDILSTNLEYVDLVAGYGNKTVRGTYPGWGDRIIPIPIPAMDMYDFPSHKDWAKSRKNFLWFGGGGAILKGLDLAVEAFAGLPHLNLTIVGNSAYEKDFADLYAKELALPNVTRYERPRIMPSGEIMTGGKPLREILDGCAAILSLSGSEGGGGATVQAMHAGVFPIVTPQTGINEEAPSMVISDPTIENIRKAAEEFSVLPAENIHKKALATWNFARANHTKEAFSRAFGDFIDTILTYKK